MFGPGGGSAGAQVFDVFITAISFVSTRLHPNALNGSHSIPSCGRVFQFADRLCPQLRCSRETRVPALHLVHHHISVSVMDDHRKAVSVLLCAADMCGLFASAAADPLLFLPCGTRLRCIHAVFCATYFGMCVHVAIMCCTALAVVNSAEHRDGVVPVCVWWRHRRLRVYTEG